jgi:hypothetical protein
MKATLALLTLLTLLTACKRRTPAAPAPTPTTPASVAAEPGGKSTPPAASAMPVSGGRIMAGDQNLLTLNNALKTYMAKHKKAPAKLDDLAKDGLIPFVPMAPPGIRYELDAARGEVKLVNPMVK